MRNIKEINFWPKQQNTFQRDALLKMQKSYSQRCQRPCITLYIYIIPAAIRHRKWKSTVQISLQWITKNFVHRLLSYLKQFIYECSKLKIFFFLFLVCLFILHRSVFVAIPIFHESHKCEAKSEMMKIKRKKKQRI